MKTRALKNYDSTVGCEVYDIDLNNDKEIIELGQLVGDQSIVFINQQITTERLHNVMNQWGDDSRALIHNYIIEKRIQGRHWREAYLNLGYLTTGLGKMSTAVSRVMYGADEKSGRPLGMFTEGELGWHCDQSATDDAPRMIGLQSVSDTNDSQTQFLCTHDAFENLSSDMKSTVKELICKHVWREGDEGLAPGLNHKQSVLIHYNSVPLNGMETKLYAETSSGRPGIKLPATSFDGFVGMNLEESWKIYNELKKAVYQEKYVYTQNWEDGQIVFMDQEITLHKRPTNIRAGNKRLMHRVITYMNKVYPQVQPSAHVRYQGEYLPHDEFAKLVDLARLIEFEQESKDEFAH